MAELIKIERAGTVLLIEEKKLDFYLKHGYSLVQSDKLPDQLKDPLYQEEQKSIEPALPIAEPVIDENIVEHPEVKPKPKPRKDSASKKKVSK